MSATVEQIAQVCHEANRGYQLAHPTEGIPVAPPWTVFPENEREGVRQGVKAALQGATPEELHRSWCDLKEAEGWIYGPVKSAAALTHPCLVAYDDLAPEQRQKDELFRAIVGSFR